MVKTRDHRKGEQGFTLIEIIAVLVILGILAVVAVPKYLDLQTEARKSAAKGLIAAAQSQLSMGYAVHKLNASDTSVTTPANECNKVVVSNADGKVTCAGTAWNANVTITANVTEGGDVTGYWNSPEAAAATDTGTGTGGTDTGAGL
uniref:Prepilin-type N-terminal cleavage/methylation domain-containing protein n=1 Tax=Desulfovibrio sp. U5L TaxID=596152 RepID=I2Q4Q9_9BACT